MAGISGTYVSGTRCMVSKCEVWFPGAKEKEFARVGNAIFSVGARLKASGEGHGGRSPAGLDGKSNGDEQ